MIRELIRMCIFFGFIGVRMIDNVIYKTCLFLFFIFFSFSSTAGSVTCVKLTSTLNSWTPKIELLNQCGEALLMQDSVLSFSTNQPIGSTYWGSFSSLAYPQSTNISQNNINGKTEALISFIFPEGSIWWKPNTLLKPGEKIVIQFSGSPQLTLTDLKFSLATTPIVGQGSIQFILPENPSDNMTLRPVITLNNDNGYVKQLDLLEFNSLYTVSAIPYGQYAINVQAIEGGSFIYQGLSSPNTINIDNNELKQINISYSKKLAKGSLSIALSPPFGLTNETIKLTLKDEVSNTVVETREVNFSDRVELSNLSAGKAYSLEINAIEDNLYRYTAKLQGENPFIAKANETHRIEVYFDKILLEKSTGTITVSGLPNGVNSTILFKDNKGYEYDYNVVNGVNTITLPLNRQYEIMAKVRQYNGKTYTPILNSKSFITEQHQTFSISLNYKAKEVVTRFSPYVDITLGTVTRWDSLTQSMQPVGLIEMVDEAKLKSLHLAFITGTSQCRGTWAGYPVENRENGYAVPVFKALKDKGVSLTIALGGLSGQYLAQTCQTQAQLVEAYQEIIDAYQPDRLDFDVENTLQTDNEKLARMMAAIKVIRANNNNIAISFTLPVLPEGLVKGVGENVIIQAKNAGLFDYGLNVMAMDYGAYYSHKSMGQYAIDALKATFLQLKTLYPNQSDAEIWARLEVTPMIGLNDTIPLNFSLEDVETLKTFAREKGLGMLSIWSLTRDKPCNYSYASPLCSSQNPITGQPNQSFNYEYSLSFGR